MLVTCDKTERPHGALLQLDIDTRYEMYRIGGRRRDADASLQGVALGIPPLSYLVSQRTTMKLVGGQCQVGSLTGAVAS